MYLFSILHQNINLTAENFVIFRMPNCTSGELLVVSVDGLEVDGMKLLCLTCFGSLVMYT